MVKLLGPLFKSVLALISAASMSLAETAPVRVALVDTENLSYPGNPTPNRELIRDQVLPFIFLDREVRFFSARLSADDGTYSADFEGNDIVTLSPDVVLIHWTSFPPPEGLDFCAPKGAEGPRNCAAQILAFLFSLHRENPEAKFMIYSRADNICGSIFQASLERLLRQRISDDEAVVAAFMQKIGFMVMRSRLGRENFSDDEVTASIRRLADLLSSNRIPLLEADPRDGLCGWDGR